MPDFVKVTYDKTGASQSANPMGMRAMQERVYQDRGAQYLLVKAPPASGKSRALMFVGLDKLENQGRKKVIVAVPERSIGSSFKTTQLTDHGFYRDWQVEDQWNLCTPGSDVSASKAKAFADFMASRSEVLVCPHATLRNAFSQIGVAAFADCLVAIDEEAYPSEPGLTTCWVCGCRRQDVRLMFCHAQPLEIRPPDVPRRLRGALSR